MLLIYIADAVWLLALGAMLGASEGAKKQISEDARLPLLFVGGRPRLRLPRNSALWFGPATGFVVSLVLLIAARSSITDGANGQLLIFGVRVFVPSLWALLHTLWLRRVLLDAQREGALKP